MQCVSLNGKTYISNLKILQQKCSKEWICLLLLQRSLKNKILIYHCILFKELQLAISNCSDFDFILDSERVVYLVMAVIKKSSIHHDIFGKLLCSHNSRMRSVVFWIIHEGRDDLDLELLLKIRDALCSLISIHCFFCHVFYSLAILFFQVKIGKDSNAIAIGDFLRNWTEGVAFRILFRFSFHFGAEYYVKNKI